jgi:hypothetical protein
MVGLHMGYRMVGSGRVLTQCEVARVDTVLL